MKKLWLLASFVLLIAACTPAEVEVTRIVEQISEVEVEVTRLVETEVTRIVEVETEVTRLVEVVVTATAEPTATPEPTAEPSAETLTFEGSGDDVIDIPALRQSMITVEGNEGSNFFAVTAFDEDGNEMDALVLTTDPYFGVRPMNLTDTPVRRLQVEANGPWQIIIEPLENALFVDLAELPVTVEGTGDGIFVVGDTESSSALIKGNEGGNFFSVTVYIPRGGRNLALTTDPYEGRVIIPSEAALYEVEAAGNWTIEFEE